MYSLSQVRRALDAPSLIPEEFNRLAYRRLNRWSYNEEGVDLFEEDWDNLLILDACRHDMFCERNDLPGRTESRISRGSGTWEFLQANFAERDLTDTVYVTASPMLHRNKSELNTSLHAVVNVWQEDGWDDDLRTVMPETLGEYAREAAERYPNKRLIVHYLQPHYPFIGPTGREHFDIDTLAIWAEKRAGNLDIPDEYFVKGTEESLDIVLDHVSELLDDLEGRTVVTADHGQAFGERAFPLPIRMYGHPLGSYLDELVRVPWHVYDNGPRREITKEEPVATEDVDHDVVEDRLKQLGYV
ncbi:hypothetical protein [Halomarina oriensis]|uniref:Sulfatase-like hydrolase/transferase n=1 Tax=Halomarina oriensis TaxID=671145 RepID=A0A6B0GK78_9EURY|nr:hypothetical protein [Halomarina oriensis]MWG33203.1 hypothetical protein [Halomarina oriensis]